MTKAGPVEPARPLWVGAATAKRLDADRLDLAGERLLV
jgi:hypothetical protein